MPWFIFPVALLIMAFVGLFLTIRSYRKGESVSAKKLLGIGVLIFLGGGVFLQKMEVVDIPQLRQLLVAFDSEQRTAGDDVDVAVAVEDPQ
ncbi:MAG: hypothetical protein ACI9KE_001085 [Polyangiales bacterium]|jgi:hypothetical protein